MNRIYKLIWSKIKNCYVVASELAKRQSKSGNHLAGSVVRGALAGAVFLSLTAGVCAPVWADVNISANVANDWENGQPFRIIIGENNPSVTGAVGIAIGYGAKVANTAGIAFGADSTSGAYGIAVGRQTHATGSQSIAIGSGTGTADGANASGIQSIVLGASASATQTGAVAIGYGSTATEADVVSFGNGTRKRRLVNIAPGQADTDAVNVAQLNNVNASIQGLASAAEDSIRYFSVDANGNNASTSGPNNIAIGPSAQASDSINGSSHGGENIAIGHDSKAGLGNENLAMGHNAYAGGHLDGDMYEYHALAIGANARAELTGSIAMGSGASVPHIPKVYSDHELWPVDSIAIGTAARAEGFDATTIGRQSQAMMANATAYGNNAHANSANSVAIGNKAIAGRMVNIFESTVDSQGRRTYNTQKLLKDGGAADSAVAIGNRASAFSDWSVAVGVSSYVTGDHSVAVGDSNRATGSHSTAIGAGGSIYNVPYPGENSEPGNPNGEEDRNNYEFINANQAAGDFSTAVGNNNKTVSLNTSAFGIGNEISGADSLGIGRDNKVGTVKYSDAEPRLVDVTKEDVTGYAVGSENTITGDAETFAGAFGHLNEVSGNYSYAMGNENKIYKGATEALAIGNNITIGEESGGKGIQSIAIGNGHVITGNRSGAFGDPDIVKADDSYIVGNNSTIEKTDAAGSFVIGNDAVAEVGKSVALGSDSKATRDINTTGGYNVLTGKNDYSDSAHPEYWNSTRGAISVGTEDGKVTRQITGVAAGKADTDAVNVAQLKLAQVELVAGDNVEVIKDTSSGHAVYTIHSLNAIVKEGENITVTSDTPDTTTDTNGQTYDLSSGSEGNGTTGGNGTAGEAGGTTPEPTPSPDGQQITPSETNNHTTTYTVSTKNTVTKVEAGDNVTVEDISQSGDTNITYKISSKDTRIKNVKADYSTVNDNSNRGKLTITDTDGNSFNTDLQDTYTVKAETNPDDHTITFTRNDGGTYKAENIATMDDINNIKGDIYHLDSKIEKVGAGAAALAGLHPLDFDPDEKWDFAAAVGSYKSEQAVAIGAFYRPNEDTMFSIGGTVGNGNNMVNVGVSWKFGQKNRISANRISSAKEIIELRKNQENVHSFLADAVAGNQLDLSKIQLFPDVEENHWAYDYVATMAGNGVLEGYPDGYFKGNRNMTRYEMAAVLYRLMQNGARLSDRALTEFAPELDRIRVDTITHHKDGTPHIQRVRTIKERVEEKADPAQVADEKAEKERLAQEKKAAVQAEKERLAQEKAEAKAAKEKAAQEKKAAAKAAKEKAAQEKAAAKAAKAKAE